MSCAVGYVKNLVLRPGRARGVALVDSSVPSHRPTWSNLLSSPTHCCAIGDFSNSMITRCGSCNATLVVLMGSVGFLIAGIVEDRRAGVMALLFLSLCIPAYALASRSRRSRMPQLAPEPELMP